MNKYNKNPTDPGLRDNFQQQYFPTKRFEFIE